MAQKQLTSTIKLSEHELVVASLNPLGLRQVYSFLDHNFSLSGS